MANIFREAADLLHKKDAGAELTEDELGLVNTAIIPLMVKTYGVFPEDITISEGLLELAKIVEEAKQSGAIPKRNQVRTVSPVR